MPKNPDPNHPMHAAAAAIEKELPGTTPPGDPTPEVTPLPTPVPTSTPAPNPAEPPRTPAPEPSPEDRLEQYRRTMEGRFEAQNSETRELRRLLEARTQNDSFASDKLNAAIRERDEAVARLRAAETERDVAAAGREFKSELVDQETFTEIYRGLNPHLQRLNDTVERLSNDLAVSNKRIAEMDTVIEQRVSKERKAFTERLLLRDEPDFSSLMERKDFKDFLAEPIPGSRGRTRAQDLMDAYNEGDTAYMAQVAADFKKRGAPQSVGTAPTDAPRSVGSPQPRAPVKEEEIAEDDLQALHERVLRNEVPESEFRKLSARYKAQQGLRVAS